MPWELKVRISPKAQSARCRCIPNRSVGVPPAVARATCPRWGWRRRSRGVNPTIGLKRASRSSSASSNLSRTACRTCRSTSRSLRSLSSLRSKRLPLSRLSCKTSHPSRSSTKRCPYHRQPSCRAEDSFSEHPSSLQPSCRNRKILVVSRVHCFVAGSMWPFLLRFAPRTRGQGRGQEQSSGR